jgi:integrase
MARQSKSAAGNDRRIDMISVASASPATIADTLAGIRREARARPSARKAAITARELATMIAAAEGQGRRPIRDRVIMALGLAAALRRSELVALEWRDVELVDKGLKLTLRHSKTDWEGGR